MRSKYQRARRCLTEKPSAVGVAAVILLLAALGVRPSLAQVPEIINFQGRVTVSGTNYTGTGSFLFELMNGTGPDGFWGNDGSIPPATPVQLPVSNGMFSVSLGDTSLAHMVAIPYSVFTNNDVRLRVWFNGQRLDPDQRIAAAGYAMVAADVPDGVVTSNKLAPNSVTQVAVNNGYVDLTSAQTISGVKLLTTNLLMRQGSDDSVRWSVGVGNFTDPESGVHTNLLSFSKNGTVQFLMAPNEGLYSLYGVSAEGDIMAGGDIGADGKLAGQSIDCSGDAYVGGNLAVHGGGTEWCAAFNGGNTYVGGSLSVNGSLTVNGTKSFVQPHPADPAREIVYTCLEGPEAGTYVRGSAEMVNGKTVITLPDNFSLVTSTNGLTVQLTPRGTWLELYVTTATVTQVTVVEAQGRSGQFDYLVQGVRLGYENQPVIRERKDVGAKR